MANYAKWFFMSKRLDWLAYIYQDFKLKKEFTNWLNSKPRKIRSDRKLAYLFLKHKFGNQWIRWAKRNLLVLSIDEQISIAKTPWINYPEED